MFVDGGSVNLAFVSFYNNVAEFDGDSINFVSGTFSASSISMDGDVGGISSKSMVCSSSCKVGQYGNCSIAEGTLGCFVNCVCLDCDVGKASSIAAATSSDVCISCGAGQVSASGASTCTSCVPGKYATTNHSIHDGGQSTQVITCPLFTSLCSNIFFNRHNLHRCCIFSGLKWGD